MRQAVIAESDSIGDANGIGVFVEDTVAPVVRQCWSEVKTVQCAEVPGAADGGFVVYENLAAGRAHGSGIEEVGPKLGFPCRWFGGGCGRAEQIEGEFRLWEEQVPSIRREGGR